ncbi:hypothetical protein J1614_003504 [Plenodomus biglobosus]|nr:hypothetical protein J1614_003504 [Plenodomus biglobosus]
MTLSVALGQRLGLGDVDDMHMLGQDGGARGHGGRWPPLVSRAGQGRPTSRPDLQALRRRDDGPSRLPDSLQTTAASSTLCSADLDDVDIASSPQLVARHRNSHSHCHYAPEEDGFGSMVVASAPEPAHDASSHDAASEALPPPAPPQRMPDMDVAAATVDAAPMAALPPTTDAGAPGHDNMSLAATFPPGLPALDPPVAYGHDDSLDAMDLHMAMATATHNAAFTPMDFSAVPPPTTDERVNAYARLRFDDGSYYMHTYQIVLGRNIHLAHRDMRRLARVDQLHAKGQPRAAEQLLNGRASKKRKRDHRGARSVISEKGGIVNAPIESMPVDFQQRRLSNASHSLSSASHPTADSGEEKPAERAPQDVLMQSFPEVPAQFDSQVPENPDDCPFVPIHPQHITAKTGAQGPKGISRRHAKIFYDFENRNFCVKVLGSNGLHHENVFIPAGQVVPLDHGDHLLIGAVNIQFFLPDIALNGNEHLQQEPVSRPMSFSFENGHGEQESDEVESSESEGELSVNPKHVYHYPIDSESDSDDAMGDDDMDDYEEPIPRPRQKQSLKIKIKNPPPPPPPPKELKKVHKRKHREPSPEEPPVKKAKHKAKEQPQEPVKEPKAPKEVKISKETKEQKEAKELKDVEKPKEPKEPKDKGKAPAKAPAKTPIKSETPVEQVTQETSVKEVEPPVKSVPNDSPPLLRKPFEGELEAGGEIDGLITEEMARQHNLPSSLIGHVVEKRKGPGRPPKDGIMSKRQRSQLVKQAKEIEKARAAGIDIKDIPPPPIKAKVPKRKESNAAEGEDDEGVMESTEGGDGTMMGDKKSMKPSKPPRTPSPEMRIEDYTEEQLQRPSANYVVLIHEAISSSSTGQMNLQQIYNYIEKKYPWYKFKTTTSGWQSSVRHNLGQHDAFVKGDKEGKGFNWRVNPEVSIEKERRKRQVSPPTNHTQRPSYYPAPNGYAPYPPPNYPYHPGMPHGMPPAAPRLPPSLAQPRLPPSMARDANAAAPSASQGGSHPSPYASPWGGGNAAGSPPVPNPPRPYPPQSSQPPPASSAAGSSGQYGVLYPTAAPSPYSAPPAASPYGGPYAAAGQSPYAQAPPRPYAPYPPQSQHNNGATPSTIAPPAASPYAAQSPYGPPPPGPQADGHAPHPSGRYPLATHPDLIRQLEAFRKVYLDARKEPGEREKVDNAIRACVDTTVPEASLTNAERQLLTSISRVDGIAKHLKRPPSTQQEGTPATAPASTSTIDAGTAAAIAADAAVGNGASQEQSNTQSPSLATEPGTEQTSQSQPQSFTPNMTGGSSGFPAASAPAVPPLPLSHRPSVEPITPVPGSPAVQNSTPLKRQMTELDMDSGPDAEEAEKAKAEHDSLAKME